MLSTYTTKGSLWSGSFKGRPIHQCEKSANACPAVKQRKIDASRKKFGTDYPWQTQEILEKKINSNIEKYGHACTLLNETVQEKRKNTMIERYGVEEPTLNKEIRSKAAAATKQAYVDDPTRANRMIKTRRERYGNNSELIVAKCRETRISTGDWVDATDIKLWENYKCRVKYHTTKNYKKYKHLINPDNLILGRITFHLDHMFSKKEGFDKNIDPKMIGHPANLRVIDALANRQKFKSSCHTIEELLEKIKNWND